MIKNSDDHERCSGCGKVLDPTAAYVVIERVGKEPRKGLRPKQLWGRMHGTCFARMTNRPRDLLEILQQDEDKLLAGA